MAAAVTDPAYAATAGITPALRAGQLRRLGVDVEPVFHPDDHEPALGHEYQFDLTASAARSGAAVDDRLRPPGDTMRR